MKSLLLVTLMFYCLPSFALGGFGSYSDVDQKILKTIVSELGIEDSSNELKEKIFNKIDYALKGTFGSNWIVGKDLQDSKVKEGEYGNFIELAVNTEDAGTYFITFIYSREVKQIAVITRQVRHGSRKTALAKYEKDKEDSKYEVRHQSSSYATVNRKGYIDFMYYNVGSESASLVYLDMTLIDI